MNKFILVLHLTTFAFSALADQEIHINIEADEYGEYIDNERSIDVDWVKTDDGFVFNKLISVNELPFTTCIYNSCLKVRANGYVSFGGFAGDYDAGAEAFFYIPRLENGDFFKAQEAYHFNIEGGEYASGLWSTSADIKIMILND
tara:strand:+ start:241 stop:675 length:435 start_codon:yes stop_codon:yes gene_type:complete